MAGYPGLHHQLILIKSPRTSSAFQSTRFSVLDTTYSFATSIVRAKGSIQSATRVASRQVFIAGITTAPDQRWMEQMARKLSLADTGFLNGCRYLLHDRNARFCAAFTGIQKAVGIQAVKLPVRSPNLKGKVERSHFFWQERLPAFFASEQITDIDQANPHIQNLRLHRNHHEIHRELQMKPSQAWNLALKEKRSALRPVPLCPWWPFVWSLRTPIRVAADGRVPIGAQNARVQAHPGTKLILCHHPSGHYSVLATQPDPKTKPLILFTNLPK